MQTPSFKKWAAGAAVALAALVGPIIPAHAVLFNNGDAVLVLYGNNTEYYQDLGNLNTVLNTGVNLDLSSIINTNSPGGAGPASTPIKFTLYGYTGASSTDSVFFGTGTQLSSWTSLNKSLLNVSGIASAIGSYQFLLNNANDTRNLVPATDNLSFSTNLDAGGTGTFGGLSPRQVFSSIDSTLYLLERQIGGTSGSLAQVGTATLSSSTGHFVIAAPVPVPAAAILFATGLVGLATMARRRVMGQA